MGLSTSILMLLHYMIHQLLNRMLIDCANYEFQFNPGFLGPSLLTILEFFNKISVFFCVISTLGGKQIWSQVLYILARIDY